MARYSIYSLDRNKQIVKLTLLEAGSDVEASRQAEALVDENAIELWRDQRKLKRFDPRAVKKSVKRSAAPDGRVQTQLESALALHRAGKLKEAAKAYAGVLVLDNDNPQAITLLGTIHAQQGHLKLAVKLLTRSLEIDDRQAFAFNSLGNALNALERYDDALAAFDKAIALDPDQAAFYSNGGNALKALKRHKEALAAYRKAVTVDPKYVEAFSNRADLLLELKRYDDAIATYDQAIALRPDSTRDWFGKAYALQETARWEQSLESYDRAIALKSDVADGWNNRGNVLVSLRRYDEALESYQTAVGLKPGHAAAYNNWGNALKDLGRFEEALALYERAIAQNKDYADAHSNRGLVLAALGRNADALTSFERAIACRPKISEYHRNRGDILRTLKRYDDAVASYDKAIVLKPDFAEAHNSRGGVLARLQCYEDALKSYDTAIRLRPDFAQAHWHQGNVWKDIRKYNHALSSYDRAIAAKPDYAIAYVSRGEALHKLGRFEPAVASFDRATELAPGDAVAHFRRSNSLKALSRFDEALQSIERAIELDPAMQYAVGQRFVIKLHMCDWNGLDAASAAVLEAIEGGSSSCVPLPVIGTPEVQRRWAELYVQEKFPPVASEPLPTPTASQNERIRVAYLSADFHSHATTCLMAGVWEQHDRNRFETYALSFGKSDGSPMRARVEKAFDHFIDVRDMSDSDVVSLLREYNMDIAVDLKGFTREARTGIFALRPAPIQINYLGYPGTMGADYIDYIIADPIVVPADEQSNYSEHVVYLPDTYQCNDSKRESSPSKPSRTEVGLPETGFVFCSFNNNYKIRPDLFDIWMRLFKGTEGSVLWLLQSNPAAARNLRREAELRGVDGARLIFAPLTPYPDHLSRIGLADLFLDTLPYGAHTTASDALWAHVPVLTCMGTTFAGRVAASLLSAIDLPEMVTHSLAEYEARAFALAHDPSALAKVKAKLVRNHKTTPLFDTTRFTRHLEAAYVTMVQRHRAGEPPIGFAVDLENTERV